MARHFLIQCDLCGAITKEPRAANFSVVIRWENVIPHGNGIHPQECSTPVTLGDLCVDCLVTLKNQLHEEIVGAVQDLTKKEAVELPYQVARPQPTEQS